MSAADPSGLGARLAALGEGVLGIVQTRLSLLAVEVEEEGIRLGAVLFNLILAAFFIAFGFFALAIFLTLLLWESHRVLVIGLSMLFFFGMALWSGMNALRRLREGKRLFTDSVAELQRDRDALGGGLE
ncbi:MAG: phage holin family protein [Candidatus Dactylopiibacterium sp.]|nr:phage holin family protein [Candidatus Dactylopiibacterium sp.]